MNMFGRVDEDANENFFIQIFYDNRKHMCQLVIKIEINYKFFKKLFFIIV